MDRVELYTVEPIDDFTESEKRLVRKKRFYSLPSQIDELVRELAQGKFTGERFLRSDDPPYDVYKKRLPNPDANVGKSNGYRVIYLAEHAHRTVALLAIYYKKEQESLTETYILGLIDGFFMSHESD